MSKKQGNINRVMSVMLKYTLVGNKISNNLKNKCNMNDFAVKNTRFAHDLYFHILGIQCKKKKYFFFLISET